MIDDRSAVTGRRAEVERRSAGGAVQARSPQHSPVAVYDTVTEGMLGWRFLRTGRWVRFAVLAVLFAIACGFLAHWQFSRGQEASANNSTVAANFAADPVPIEQALTTLGSYDSAQSWQRVSMSGVYLVDDEVYARNRSNSGANGFEVLTPLQLKNGNTFLVDRGWIEPSPDDALAPAAPPPPPIGTVTVVAQLRPSEAPQGTAITSGAQIASIALPRVQSKIGGDLYTGAYGVLVSETPPGAAGLSPIQTSVPVEDVGVHVSYSVQWVAFALIGFLVLGLGARAEFRRLNSDDPEERERATERVRKRASRPFTDEELEDEAIDGYLPLTRWGLTGGGAITGAPARAALPGAQGALEEAPDARVPESDDARLQAAAPDVYVIESGDPKP